MFDAVRIEGLVMIQQFPLKGDTQRIGRKSFLELILVQHLTYVLPCLHIQHYAAAIIAATNKQLHRLSASDFWTETAAVFSMLGA
mmetsp:Transcript_32142/g.92948  ORF Transcript_32142/g.92948 Transcript_32142/m.92948 type:complete len:85 (-) Transcript_32142:24-278(-)